MLGAPRPQPRYLSNRLGRVKPRNDAADYSLDVLLGLATVADVPYPQSADPDQPLNVIPQWFFEVSQIPGAGYSIGYEQRRMSCPYQGLFVNVLSFRILAK